MVLNVIAQLSFLLPFCGGLYSYFVHIPFNIQLSESIRSYWSHGFGGPDFAGLFITLVFIRGFPHLFLFGCGRNNFFSIVPRPRLFVLGTNYIILY